MSEFSSCRPPGPVSSQKLLWGVAALLVGVALWMEGCSLDAQDVLPMKKLEEGPCIVALDNGGMLEIIEIEVKDLKQGSVELLLSCPSHDFPLQSRIPDASHCLAQCEKDKIKVVFSAFCEDFQEMTQEDLAASMMR